MRVFKPLLAALTCCATTLAAAAAPEAVAAPAVDRLLTEFPYTPGLDVTAMDRNADPCVDFYQYSCGGWQQRNPIPPDQASWSVYGKLYQDNQRFLWGILDGLARQQQGRNDGQQKIGDYFAACMDEGAIEAAGARPLAGMLDSIEALRNKSGLPALLAQLQLQSGDSGFLFSFGSRQDFGDSAQVIAYADAGGLGLPDRDYYTDTDAHAQQLRTQYRRHVAQVFRQLGDAPAAAAHHAAAVLRLEAELAQASLKLVDRRDPYMLYHKLDRAAVSQLTPHFDWNAYLRPLELADIGAINVAEPKFFSALDALLATVSLADLKTYLRWHAANSAARYLSKSFEDQRFAFFDHTLRGVPLQKPRWKRCVAQVDAQLGEALGREFVARSFGPELKAATLKLTAQIQQAMRQDIAQLDWMSDATKRQALAKLDTMVNKIGYPDRWRDYSSIDIRRDDYFGNVLRANSFEGRRQLARIGKPLDRSEWGMTPPTVNAYYDPQMNDINFPAGVLQPPLYDARMDDAPNYGDTGGTIGHELTHGFDDEGRQFDSTGSLKDWWTPADADKFKQRAQCIVDQYAQYVVVDDIHINSKLTLGEDVADLGGLVLAHVAWRAQTANQTLENRDGLTPEQRFFVGYAQWACENDRTENQRLNAKTDPHSPGRYRVNGIMVNMPEFAHAFACKVAQPMVSAKRCRVW
ncbi:MAG: M13 family metallopeptidase [Steroidobacteraceae bacterium]